MEYRTCDICGKSFPLTRKYFIRHTKGGNGEYFINTCKECEIKQKYDSEWKDGKLKCHSCGRFLEVSEFGKNKNKYRDNHDSRCRECRTVQARDRKAKYNDDIRLLKILLMRYLGAKERSIKLNIPFDITREYLKELWDKQSGICAISNIPMTFDVNKGRVWTNVSIDQINPKAGYTKDNILLVCMAINQMKSDLDINTLLYFCKAVVNNSIECKKMAS